MKTLSLIRSAEHAALAKLDLNGSILDLGGNKASGYHQVLRGTHTIAVVNFGDVHPGADLVFDIQLPFPLESQSFDHILCLNVLEHIYDYQAVVRESARVLRPGGHFVGATPFMHHIHGSPDDYFRYTESALKKLFESHDFHITCAPIGAGIFSLFYQSCGGVLPGFLQPILRSVCTGLDSLCSISGAYRRLASRIPLGYFFVATKK